jgi:LysR family hydrogen peroxide-inducible transcriptional activator
MTDEITTIAQQGKDPLTGPLRLDVIHTVAPYLLPPLVHTMIKNVPEMPLILREDYTYPLLDKVRYAEIHVAIIAEPFSEQGLSESPLYDKPFVIAVLHRHRWAGREAVATEELATQTTLLLGSGHCMREQVLAICPPFAAAAFGAPNQIAHLRGGSRPPTRLQ